MTGLEKMKSQILEEAETSAKAILADAQKQADAVKEKGKAEAEAICGEISKKSCEEVKSIEERSVSSCDLQRRKALLTAKQEIIAEVLASAYQTLMQADDKTYFSILRKMLYRFVLPQEGEICFSDVDLKRMPQGFKEEISAIAEEKGGVLTISEESRKVQGGFVLVYGGIEENCTFEAMFSSQKDEFSDKIYQILFL